MKRIFLFSLILFVLLIPEWSNSQDKNDIPIYKVGYIPGSPPYQYAEKGLAKGFNVDIMNEIAEKQGFELAYYPMTQKNIMESIKTGEIDIILGIPYTKNNNEIMDFTDSYVNTEISILAPKGSEINQFEDIDSVRVALQANTLEYEFMKNIRNVDLHVSQKQDVGLKLLIKKRADIFVGNYMTMKYLMKEKSIEAEYEIIEDRLLSSDYSFAVQKENYTLLNQLNKGINKLKLSSEYSTIYNKWFEALDTPISKKLKKLLDFVVVLLIISIIVFLFSLRWNRQLKKEVNRKTKDLQDINESLEIQIKKTKESNQMKEQVLESSLRGVITLDISGRILTMNTVACDLFGVNKSIIGKKLKNEILIGNELHEKIYGVLETKERYLDQELNISQYTKNVEYIKYDIQPIYNIDQDIAGVLLFILDVTQDKKLQDYLYEEEKSQVLIQLVAGLVHEIRNPLTSIKTFVEMIPSKIDNLVFRNEIATHVPREIDRLNKLLESLINYAKPGGQHSKVIYLSELLKSTALLFASNIENKGYNLELNIESELKIKGDEDQIKQVFINIILNAMESIDNRKKKYNNDRPTITINLFNRKNKNIVEIRDNGIGMSKETLNHIFDPFYTTKAEGTGLGLGISRQFIKENKGEIFLDSELEKGSTFTLIFIKWGSHDEEDINNR